MPPAEPAGRLLVEREPRPGAWNMAFDEALLEAAATRGETALRIYRWSEPTLSLGYFQKEIPPDLPETLRGLPRVRRLSGGGAILHDHEWTYACALPKGHPLTVRTEDLYDIVHAAILRAFARLGIAAGVRGESNRQADARFLCFERGDARDILIAGRKVVGSAQRRRKGAVLQHGSVVLRTSSFAPHLPGVADLVPGLSDDPCLAAPEFTAEIRQAVFAADPVEFPHPADLEFASAAAAGYGV
jgi:lipoate-protein ligase A